VCVDILFNIYVELYLYTKYTKFNTYPKLQRSIRCEAKVWYIENQVIASL